MLDTLAKRIALGIGIGLLVVAAWQNGWLSEVVPSPTMADTVCVIEESGERTAEQAAVLLGKTSIALREAGHWRLLDDDELPESMEPIVAKITMKLPYVLFMVEGRVVSGPAALPKTEAEFTAMVKRGGF